MAKRILIHSIVFSPDGVSTAYLYNDIATGLKNSGYEVIVLTTTPHYNVVDSARSEQPMTKKAFGLYYESVYEGIKVLHVPQKKFKSTALRILGFIFWHIVSFILGIKQKNIAAILSPSPPLTIGFINILIAKIKGAKVIYNVQEIYPDFLIEQGGLKNKVVINILKRLESLIYNKSDAVTTIDQVFYNTIISRFDEPSKLRIIPNFVDTDLYKPLDKQFLHLDENLFKKNNRLKLMYAGNIGHAQDWEPLIGAAIRLKGQPVDFYIIGEGVMKSYIEESVTNNDLTNVFVLPYQPRKLMPQLLAFADLQFIFMSKEMEGHGFPSKVYTIMAAAKPLIVISGEKTPIYQFLKPYNCAKLITTVDLDEKINEICSFITRSSLEELENMGQDGFDIIKENYAKDVVIKQYVSLFDNLLRK